MAIRFITGKPGDGKSMVGTHTMVRQVLQTKRQIVTNLPLLPGPLWAFIKTKYGLDYDTARLTMLTEDEVKQFYLYRGGGWVAPKPVERKEGGDGRVDYANCRRTVEASPGVMVEETRAVKDLPSVLYIIDEAHLHFGSRQWADTAQSALFYLSQHRHLGDEVFFITQHVKQVDSALRRLAAEFWKVTNYGNRFPFGVKLPDYFVIDVYMSEPGLLTARYDTNKLKLDVEGLGACYDTAGGIGMVGGLADTQNKRKGLPWQVLPVVMVVAAVLLLFMAKGAGNLFGQQLVGGPPSAVKPFPPSPLTNSVTVVTRPPPSPSVKLEAASGPTPAQVAAMVAAMQPPALPAPLPPVMNTNGAQMRTVSFGPPVEPARIKWMIRKVGSVALGMSNGDTFTVGDGRLQVAGQFAILDGSKIFRLPE